MRYPKNGAYKQFLKVMAEVVGIRYNKEVINIDPLNKIIIFSDGESIEYSCLISSFTLSVMARS